MSVKDEFYSLPPEYMPLPKEAAERRDEENCYTAKSSVSISKVEKENREKQKRNSLIKMMAGALISVSVITNVAGNDIFYRTTEANAQIYSISRYEMYTSLDSGLVDNDDRTAYLTDGHESIHTETAVNTDTEVAVNADTGTAVNTDTGTAVNTDTGTAVNTDVEAVIPNEIINDDIVLIEIDCPTCNGAGIICPGSAAADDPEGCHGAIIVDCKACNGTGYEADGKICNWCKGTLRHLCPSFESHYECPDCKGTGRITE